MATYLSNHVKYTLLILSLLTYTLTAFAQDTLYVKPDAASSSSANGTITNPYNDIAAAADSLVSTGGVVYIIDGTYDMSGKEVTIETKATDSTVITIKPQTMAGVTLKFDGRFGF